MCEGSAGTSRMINQIHCERESLLPVRQKRRSDRDQTCFYEANKVCEILKGPTAGVVKGGLSSPFKEWPTELQ